MKSIAIIICLILSQSLFGQDFLLDSIKAIQERNLPADGESFCTPGYWVAERDGGQRTFERLCQMESDMEFVMSDSKLAKNHAVYVMDFMRDGVKRDEIYFFAVKKKGKWLMDGFNESKGMIESFMMGNCSGYFNPTSLPKDAELEKVAKEMLKYTKDLDGLNTYLSSVTTTDSDFSSVVGQFVDESYAVVKFISAGYSEEMDRGYIYFEQFEKDDDFGWEITMYLERVEGGKHRVTGYAFTSPSSRFFFD
ncbi:MAG: hypothetical protein ACI837_000263 [Crocinitomicaceae bacterium]|jgi:hypothetical protein